MYFLLNFVTGFLFIVCTNADIINSNLINQLLNKNKDRIVKEFKQTDFSQGIVDNYVMDLLSNYILRSSKINFPTAFSDSVSLQCKSDSILYMEEVLLQSIAPNADSWALRMLESNGPLPQGLHIPIIKNKRAFGLFDECLDIRTQNHRTVTSFQGRYCTVYFRPTKAVLANGNNISKFTNSARNDWINIMEQWNVLKTADAVPQVGDSNFYDYVVSPSKAFCLPSSCKAEDLRQAVAEVVGNFAISEAGNETFVSVITATDKNQCYSNSDTPPEYDSADTMVLVTICLIGMLLISATVLELVRNYQKRPVGDKKDSLAMRGLHCFSLLSNISAITNTDSSVSDEISAMNGIRAINNIWLLAAHVGMETTHSSSTPKLQYEDRKTFRKHLFVNSTVSCDSFFVMGGMLTTYSLLCELDRNKGQLNILRHYAHRFLRLIPTYAVVLGFLSTLVVYCGDGPNWNNVRVVSNECRQNWWAHLLHINNFFDADFYKTCMMETWYAANDMQFFLISPFIIYPIWRWKTTGLILLAVLTLGSLVSNIVIFATNDIPMYFPLEMYLNRKSEINKYFNLVYYKPWTRANTYFVGIFLGWLIFQTKKTDFKLNKNQVAVLWVTSVLSRIAAVFVGMLYVEENPSKAISVLYGSFHRIVYATGLAWELYALMFGYARAQGRFLSGRAFKLLSRLNFCVYLININYLRIFHSRSRVAVYHTLLDEFHMFCSAFIVIYLLAFALTVCIEMPFTNLQKLMFSRGEAVKENKSN